VTEDNIVDTVTTTENADISKLEALVKDAKTLKEADYTADSWKNFAGELEEAEEEDEIVENSAVIDFENEPDYLDDDNDEEEDEIPNRAHDEEDEEE
jgi:hypothetical protein